MKVHKLRDDGIEQWVEVPLNLFTLGKALSIDQNGNFVSIDVSGGTPTPSGKLPKSIPGSAMSADNIYVYEITPSDITALGTTINVIGLLVNNEKSMSIWSFSGNQGSLTSGDTITFTGLPAKVDVTTINFSLI